MTTPTFIRLDLLPATVTLYEGVNSTTLNGATRVIVTDTEVFVYQDSYNGPKIVLQGPLADFTGDNNKVGWTVQIDDGPRLEIVRSRGCACGSLLRSLAPFPGVPYQAAQ